MMNSRISAHGRRRRWRHSGGVPNEKYCPIVHIYSTFVGKLVQFHEHVCLGGWGFEGRGERYCCSFECIPQQGPTGMGAIFYSSVDLISAGLNPDEAFFLQIALHFMQLLWKTPKLHKTKKWKIRFSIFLLGINFRGCYKKYKLGFQLRMIKIDIQK